ncbi:MAG: arginine--tRNA ligase [Candidatus Staskawiczbacteria bacterium RIFOXYB2_FULL_32_9]|uniref:Arginine--tRNA ligase n=1 Tax=Candidatus Staskawiczbacteria bacterium RIFOXYD1_FULL_32_13 TaxID=1802234 RepID=A0A1G2JQR3_9BACT|nr:MAG: Arginine-tRNA ligase [Parcubacteria group bacterium GW2011_GWC2_32_10]OGZ80210.1 MAG: arginine--tRNA ligase [Candidatus Staskawiczbacteria bacterium RIFOXYA2_FULL_32_7]OGZ80762.1 MAG: arginine--tRNA ligase [Candidatus Staskawiczbacteria bacterium RIFOXYB1_FULL_32_11]OGZ82298.1 MAG: arginine--tRNA ligase [Candidatus Staskawiczbacteria bacterium RIFOXYB2_FULL_32_9]OGZ86881.1 MAG: arginine--tRNA ligase [Candidatus Staskawiczbacteria bacterium RIFOXYC2_FULL_32_10]OGZ89465.1 MAG: arginine--
MKQKIKKIIAKAIKEIGVEKIPEILVEVPKNLEHGDYSTNTAMILKKNPIEIAEKIKSDLFKKIEVKNGFINFFVSDKYIIENIKKINKNFGKNNNLKIKEANGSERSRRIILDYTDPNPFKEFHIGHLMSNAIGESLSRIFEFQGAKVKRVCYQGDVGMHVAKAIWGKIKNKNLKWPEAYAFGAKEFTDNENSKKEITELNKKVFEKSDKNINKLYDQGKKESLKYFDKIYKKLDTKFDWLIFESQVADLGKKTVEKGLKSKVFEKGENSAIIFKGEKFGLHTRVFINSEGIPTYEAKDLGLAQIKYKKYPYDLSFVVTGNEINEYFKVMKQAMQEVLPDLANKTNHIGHGMLRLPEGKMSSRTGKIITGESLLGKLQEMVIEKIKDEDFSKKEQQEIAEAVAVGAVRYSILKQSIGGDVIYDFDKSISFDGDSGPYLQYSFARAKSILRKAKQEKINKSFAKIPNEVSQLEKMLCQFPEIIEKAGTEKEPHFILLYLTELAGCFNTYYAKNKIVDKSDEFSAYKVALTEAFTVVMKNGMHLLGIKTLEKM